MPSQTNVERPLRVGVFDSPLTANMAVEELLSAGFTKDQITVICSEKAIQNLFKEYEHQDPAGAHTPAAAAAGGALGAAIGGLAVVAGLATGGAVLLAAGGLAMWTGGVVGGLVGAMMTRGVEREMANFYDQAVLRGQILVGAEELDPKKENKLARASEIFAEHGVHPLSLPEG